MSEIDDLTIGAVMRRMSVLENDLRMLEARHKALVAAFYARPIKMDRKCAIEAGEGK